MDISRLAAVYQADGPFASVTLDVGHDTESGAREHELRVRTVREQLTEAGAPQDVVERVGATLAETVEDATPLARTVVANAAGICFDELVHRRVDDAQVTWGPVPDLLGWLRLADRQVRFALALVDHVGGDVSVYNSDVPQPESETTAGGETEHVKKTGKGGWAALKFEHQTEKVWRENAEAVVAELESVISGGIRLVLLAGDPKSVAEVTERLEKSQAEVIRLDTGHRGEDGGDEALAHAIREVLSKHEAARRVELAHQLRDRMGRDFAVATGVRDVADALVRGQVETLVLDPDDLPGHRLRVSDHPGFPGAVQGELRADLALLSAAAQTAADVEVLPRAALGGIPVAALLRWDQEA